MKVSVVIPMYNAAETIAECLRSLTNQTMAKQDYEVIVVDDGSSDDSAALARAFGVTVVSQANAGAPAARNTGIEQARAPWVAFTDSDCVCSRNWLASLVAAAEKEPGSIGAAGKTIGYRSVTDAARFVDLMGGLDPIRSLQHPRFPFAPTSNALYSREALKAARGFDTRFATYDACDLHTRLLRIAARPFAYEPRALVMHRHRPTWRGYWRQQFFYGVGYAQFMLAHSDELAWSAGHQLRALADLAARAAAALRPGRGDGALMRKGWLVRTAAQQAGFLRTYYDKQERRRWRTS